MKGLLVVLLCAGGFAAQEAAVGIQQLLDAGDASYLKEDYESARQSFAQAWELAQQQPASDPVLVRSAEAADRGARRRRGVRRCR